MIHFDRKTLAVLRYISRHGERGVSWQQLRRRFGEDCANPFLLETLSRELYTVTRGHCREWLSFDASWDKIVYDDFMSFCTPKGSELLEARSFNFWKWVIPTLISVSALIVSVIAALN